MMISPEARVVYCLTSVCHDDEADKLTQALRIKKTRRNSTRLMLHGDSRRRFAVVSINSGL
jgi:hypothetical protein